VRACPWAPLLRRAGLTPEQVAEPEERLSVRNQITFLDAAAVALKDDFLGFNLARDHDPREIGLLYYVMASSQTLGDALKRIARYSRITNEAVVFRYQEGNRLPAALAGRTGDRSELRTKVENAISSVLPHQRVRVEYVARNLGMSKRTLARKLADEGLNFSEIFQNLRHDLAVRYLEDGKLHVSKIAWLLGFNEVSAFTHAFKRWTGKTPRQMRTGGA
jgi:AraC-like DNA-binding protein